MGSEQGGAELNFQLISSSGEGSLGTLKTRPSGVAVRGGQVLYALDTGETRHLLVPLERGELAIEDRESAGVHVLERTLLADHEEIRFLDVECRIAHLNRLFSSIVDEIVLSLSESPDDVSLSCRTVLERWRELLRSTKPKRLGQSEETGLLAELLLMEQIAACDPSAALKVWTGWQSDRVDFRAQDTAVEVKATIVRDARIVEIHGIGQLEPPTNSDLYLLFTRFERSASGGSSLPEVIGRLIANGVSSSELYRRLARMGYDPADSLSYAESKFEPIERAWYLVDDAFPRIVPTSLVNGVLPERIRDVRYRIDLTGEPPVPLSSDESLSVIERLSVR